jgi:O-antigen ligase
MQRFLVASSRWLAIALAFSIPVSTALDNVLMAALLVAVLASNARAVMHTVRHNPAARAGVLLFALLAAGMFYGAAPLRIGVDMLGKYVDLAMLPIMLIALRDGVTRKRAMLAFLAAMSATAFLSLLVGLHVIPVAKWMWWGITPDNPAIFRSSITQNILMAYAVYLLGLRARNATELAKRWTNAAFALFLGTVVLFLVPGRTGYIILFALLGLFCWNEVLRRLQARGKRLDWRVPAAAALLVPIVALGVYHAVPRLHERIDMGVAEFRDWQPNVHKETSIGERMEFYYNTFSIVERHPLMGVGTGGFESAYAEQIRGKDQMLTPNPHNEYLLMFVQLGFLGLVLLLYLYVTQWRCAARLPTPYEQQAARGLVLTFAIGCLFNSLLLDHTEGIFFAFMSALWFSNLSASKNA